MHSVLPGLCQRNQARIIFFFCKMYYKILLQCGLCTKLNIYLVFECCLLHSLLVISGHVMHSFSSSSLCSIVGNIWGGGEQHYIIWRPSRSQFSFKFLILNSFLAIRNEVLQLPLKMVELSLLSNKSFQIRAPRPYHISPHLQTLNDVSQGNRALQVKIQNN